MSMTKEQLREGREAVDDMNYELGDLMRIWKLERHRAKMMRQWNCFALVRSKVEQIEQIENLMIIVRDQRHELQKIILNDVLSNGLGIL